MKRLILVTMLGVIAVFAFGMSCGGPPPVVEQPVDTTPPPPVVEEPVDTTPPPPPPKPTLKESQFQTVYFDLDKYNLRTDAKNALDANYTLLNEFPDVIVKIEGHCDERGTVEYNLSLGDKRANSTMEYLVGLGISPDKLSTISYGKERPVDSRQNEEAWDKNRRCEFRIVSQ
jgi:peptidoglycan-associated lipoprotein